VKLPSASLFFRRSESSRALCSANAPSLRLTSDNAQIRCVEGASSVTFAERLFGLQGKIGREEI
jgi:hypothetical protein